MGERFSLIVSSTPRSASGAASTLFLFRIRPQVVDTSFLVPDVVRAARDGYPTKFLSAVHFGSVRPFAGQHVWAEVPRTIAKKSAEMGASPAVAEATWWDEYVPYVRFVDVAGLALPRPEILIRDDSDAPTVALAGLVGQVVVTAKDADLRDIGVAAPDWAATIEAGYAISVVGGGAWSGLFTMRIGAYGVASAGRATFRAARDPAGQIVLEAIILGLFLARRWWVPHTERWIENFWPRVEGLVEVFGPVVEEVLTEYRAADAAWNEALFRTQESGALPLVAHLLASSPHPLNRTPDDSAALLRRGRVRAAQTHEGACTPSRDLPGRRAGQLQRLAAGSLERGLRRQLREASLLQRRALSWLPRSRDIIRPDG